MSLPSTITIDENLVFDDTSKISGTQIVYYAVSPQNDLVGRPSLRVSHERTKAGIVRSLESVQLQVYNATTGKYEGFVKADITLNRSEAVSKDIAGQCLNAAIGAMAQAPVQNAFIGAVI